MLVAAPAQIQRNYFNFREVPIGEVPIGKGYGTGFLGFGTRGFALWRPPLLFADLDGNGKLDWICLSRPSGQAVAMYSQPESRLICPEVELLLNGRRVNRRDAHQVGSNLDIQVAAGNAQGVTVEAVSLSNKDKFNAAHPFKLHKSGQFLIQAKKRGAAICTVTQDVHVHCQPGTKAATEGAPCEPISPCSFVQSSRVIQVSSRKSPLENGNVSASFEWNEVLSGMNRSDINATLDIKPFQQSVLKTPEPLSVLTGAQLATSIELPSLGKFVAELSVNGHVCSEVNWACQPALRACLRRVCVQESQDACPYKKSTHMST